MKKLLSAVIACIYPSIVLATEKNAYGAGLPEIIDSLQMLVVVCIVLLFVAVAFIITAAVAVGITMLFQKAFTAMFGQESSKHFTQASVLLTALSLLLGSSGSKRRNRRK